MNKTVVGGIRGISRAVITAVITFVLAIAVFATTAFAQLVSEYNVEIRIDNTSFVITTNQTEPIDILSQANISLAEDDKLDLTDFDSSNGGIIRIDRLNTINVRFAGKISTYDVYADTVADALKELAIDTDNVVNYALTDNVVNGMVIDIKDTPSLTMSADGEKNKYPLTDGTVLETVENAGITLGKDDYTVPSADSRIEEDMTIKVYRVEYKEETVTEKIDFDTTKKKDSSMYEDTEKVITKGVKGEDEVTYQVKYVNGKEDERKELARTTIKKPVTAVVKVGTKKCNGTRDTKPNGVKSRNGFKVGQEIKGRYTHYCACGSCGTGSGRTASGKRVHNGMPNPYYIACNWLPMGSVVNVDGTNYLVVDRGGSGLSAVGRIDIFTPEGHAACYRYGVGSCKLTIVRLGW